MRCRAAGSASWGLGFRGWEIGLRIGVGFRVVLVHVGGIKYIYQMHRRITDEATNQSMIEVRKTRKSRSANCIDINQDLLRTCWQSLSEMIVNARWWSLWS